MEQAAVKDVICNGVNVSDLTATIEAVQKDPSLAGFKFSAKNQWLDAGHNQSTFREFYGCGQIDQSRTQAFVLDADEPPVLLGQDAGPNPVEFILHGLAGCMTTSMVYHAAARGIDIAAVSSEFEGDLDLRGFLGLSDEVRKGYKQIRVSMHVQTTASVETLRECIGYSPVYEMISRAVPVDVRIETY